MEYKRSQELYEKARRLLVGGVNSPVRAYKAVGGNPLFIDRAKGPFVWDADHNQYIDYVGSYGPHILGHNPPQVMEAVQKAMEKGTSFGASSEMELKLAELVNEAFPTMEKIRFVSSGTEAVMSVIRLARAFTGKRKLIKFAGCYHGHSDYLLAQSGSGLLTLSMPGSAGVPETTVQDTLIARYNDIHSVESLFEAHAGEIAAVLIEPVAGNMGVVLPQDDFLSQLRQLTYKQEALLVFDEVMTGFRERFGGAQGTFNINPDLTCLGKVIGGGFPVGAYGGRTEIMDMVAPLGPVYQAGTLSGNPIAMTAGWAALKTLRDYSPYGKMLEYTQKMAEGIRESATQNGIGVEVNVYGSMITPFLTDKPVADYDSATNSDTKAFAALFHQLTQNGLFMPPSQFEAWFVSAAHGPQQLEQTLEAFDKGFKSLA